MSAKAIREFDGKLMLSQWLKTHGFPTATDHIIQIVPTTQLSKIPSQHSWVNNVKLVAKPDQLIKRRGKAGLICLNKDWNETQKWIEERRDKTIKVEKVEGQLTNCHIVMSCFDPHSVTFVSLHLYSRWIVILFDGSNIHCIGLAVLLCCIDFNSFQ